MNGEWQSITAAAVVAGTALVFLVRIIRRRGAGGRPGCGGCGGRHCAPPVRKSQ
jgi:hypothetical protein